MHPHALTTALLRFGIQKELIRIIDRFYAQPDFQVKAMNHTSLTATGSGIRQGSPLSPYLFLIVHSSIIHDVESQLTQQHTVAQPWLHSQNHPLTPMTLSSPHAQQADARKY